MDNYNTKVQQAQEFFGTILDPQLSEIMDSIATYGDKDNPYTIELPEYHAVDLPLGDVLYLVAKTSNTYGRVARAAGLARAEAKRRKGAYDSKYKRSKVGKNETERENNAMTACTEEHAAWVFAESFAEVVEGIEAAARVASESIRKILGSIENQQKAADRETRGQYRERDYS